jgi:transcriptional regulator with XRE-family HTH domain
MVHGEIGRRIRAVRQERKLSLRQVAATAKLSATHISEIERGHTTPTVGALVRIAEALGCETHFFLEPEWLPEISIVQRGEAERLPNPNGNPVLVEKLSRGIPGGRLDCTMVTFEPNSIPAATPSVSGEMAGYVMSGRLELKAGDEHIQLAEEDTFHLRADLPHQIWNSGDKPARIILVATQGAQSPSR